MGLIKFLQKHKCWKRKRKNNQIWRWVDNTKTTTVTNIVMYNMNIIIKYGLISIKTIV